MSKESSNHSKAHMDDMAAKAARAKRKKVLKNVRKFREMSAAYFAKQDEECLAYSEAGLANCMEWALTKLQRYYDYNNGRDDDEIEAQVDAFETGDEVTDPRSVMSYYVQLAYQRIQEQIDTSPLYREKGMVTRGIFLNKQVRLGGYQDKMEQKQDISVNVTFGDGADADCWK